MTPIGLCILLLGLFNSSHASEQAVSPLKLNITVRTANVCLGGPVKVEAEIVNASDKEVVIDVKTIWYKLAFSFFRAGISRTNADGSGSGTNTGGSLTIVGDGGPQYEGEYLVLRPHVTYRASRNIALDDEFFKNPGNYRLKITYGQFLNAVFQEHPVWKGTVESAELNLKIITCRARKDNGTRP